MLIVSRLNKIDYDFFGKNFELFTDSKQDLEVTVDFCDDVSQQSVVVLILMVMKMRRIVIDFVGSRWTTLFTFLLYTDIIGRHESISVLLFFHSSPKQSVKSYFEQKYQEHIRPTRASLRSQSQAGECKIQMVGTWI